MTADYARFDAMLSDQLDALAQRATAATTYALDGGPASDSLDDLWQLVELARMEGDATISFGAPEREGLLASARRECAQFLRNALDAVTSAATVRSGVSGTRIHTRVGWTGDTTTLVVADASDAEVATHVAAVEASLTRSTERLRMLTAIVSAAARIAAIIAAPTAAVTALPVAYRCVRDVWKKWRASQSEAIAGGTPWQ